MSWVYILTNQRHTVLYTGSTNDLPRHLWQHRTRQSTFTKKYNVNKLVYYEHYREDYHAYQREMYIKGKKRQWKIDLINSKNKDWNDLTDHINL